MAASGRVPQEVQKLMGQTIIVREPASNEQASTLYGKPNTAIADTGREVKCLLQPAMSASRTHEAVDVSYSWDIYCDDVNITEASIITFNGEDLGTVQSVETYFDEHGPVYQVVHC